MSSKFYIVLVHVLVCPCPPCSVFFLLFFVSWLSPPHVTLCALWHVSSSTSRMGTSTFQVEMMVIMPYGHMPFQGTKSPAIPTPSGLRRWVTRSQVLRIYTKRYLLNLLQIFFRFKNRFSLSKNLGTVGTYDIYYLMCGNCSDLSCLTCFRLPWILFIISYALCF